MAFFNKSALKVCKGQSREIANLEKREAAIRENILHEIAGKIAAIHPWTDADTKRTQKIVLEHLRDEMKHKDINFLHRVYEKMTNAICSDIQILVDETTLKTFPNGLAINAIKHVNTSLTSTHYTQNQFNGTKIYAKSITTLAPKFSHLSAYHPYEFQGFEKKSFYVLTNMVGNILAIVPTDNEFIHDGVAVMKNISFIQDKFHGVTAVPYKLGTLVNLPQYETIDDDNQIIFDAKSGTITKLGNAKIADIRTSHDDKTVAFKILRPLNAVVRHFIALENGKYCTAPQIFLLDNNGKTLGKDENAQRFKRDVVVRSGKKKIKAQPTADMPEMLTQHHVAPEKFLEINQDGEIHLKCPIDTNAANHNAMIIKTPKGKYVARVDYPQAVISEEYYLSNGELLNQRFFDFDANRLYPTLSKQQKLSDFECDM